MQHDIADIVSLINAMHIKVTLLQQREHLLDDATKRHIVDDIQCMARQLANDGKYA